MEQAKPRFVLLTGDIIPVQNYLTIFGPGSQDGSALESNPWVCCGVHCCGIHDASLAVCYLLCVPLLVTAGKLVREGADLQYDDLCFDTF